MQQDFGHERLEFGLHAEVVHDKGVDVGVFVNHLAEGHAATMAGLGLDADELRGIARVGCLQCGGVFERMGGHHTVVMVGGSHHDGRVGGAVIFDVVQR